jgi:hypothetical protein
VPDPADLAHAVIVKVADFVRKLPADQLADLVSGEAKLELVPKGGRTATRSKAPVQLPRPAEEIATTMKDIGDRTAVQRYLTTDLKLTVPLLKQLAGELGVTVRARKDDIIIDLYEWAAGRSRDADVISRVGAAR